MAPNARISLEHLFPSFEDDEEVITLTDPAAQEIQESPVEDDAAFAADATQTLAEATEEGTVVQSSLEALALNIKMTRRLLGRYKGFEDDAAEAAGITNADGEVPAAPVDPVDAVVADTNTEVVATTDCDGETVEVVPDPKDLATEVAMEAFDAKKFFGGLWDGIITALKKIGQVIVGWIRQVGIWISGPFVKAQSDFYKANQAQIGELYAKAKETKMALPPPVKVSFQDAFKEVAQLVGAISKDVDVVISAVDKAVAKIASDEKGLGISNIRLATEGLSKKLDGFKGEGTDSTYIISKVYGTTDKAALKPVERSISEVFGQNDFAELDAAQAKKVTELIKSTQQLSASINKALGASQNAAKKSSGAAGDLKTSMQSIAGGISQVRGAVQFALNCVMGGFSAYSKHRSYLQSALKKLGAKGGAPAAKAEEKK